MNTKNKSERSEAAVLTEFLHRGFSVSLPFGDNQRYDLIVDLGDRLIKVQVKVGRIRNGIIIFDAQSSHDRQDYRGVIDYFAIYVFKEKQVYLVDVTEVPVTKASLRLDKPKNNQS